MDDVVVARYYLTLRLPLADHGDLEYADVEIVGLFFHSAFFQIWLNKRPLPKEPNEF